MEKGREDCRLNDLFFVCSLIEYVGRKTKNERNVIVNALGRSENIDKVTDEIINKYGIVPGTYDNVAKATDNVPTHWDIGKVMYRLVVEDAKHTGDDVIGALIRVYNSWIVQKIDDYSSSMYYENTSYQYASYMANRML